jgi:hypothetical protein
MLSLHKSILLASTTLSLGLVLSACDKDEVVDDGIADDGDADADAFTLRLSHPKTFASIRVHSRFLFLVAAVCLAGSAGAQERIDSLEVEDLLISHCCFFGPSVN